MKKQITKTIALFGLIIGSNLLAVTPEEYKEIVDSFKLKDTSKKELSQTYRINGKKIKAELLKNQEDEENFQNVQHIITVYEPYLTNKGEPKHWIGIDKYDQKLFSVACIAVDKKVVQTSIVRSSFNYKKKKQKLIQYGGFVAGIDENSSGGNYGLDGGLFDGETSSAYTSIPTYNPKEFYPYYNEEKILDRLYETGTCDKEATKQAKIEVLVDGKWIPQEQSWKTTKVKVPSVISITVDELLYNFKINKSTENTSINDLNNILSNDEINIKTLQKYNDVAYYLQQARANQESAYLLEKIIEKFPDRTVAYFNLGDAYYGLGDKTKATKAYQTYIEQMKKKGWEKKIPKKVLKRVEETL